MKLIKDLGMQYATEKSKSKRRFGIYECSCGQQFKTMTAKVKNGRTSSCPECARRRSIEASITHGMSDTSLHKKWNNIKTRCYNPKASNYIRYGGKGITVCPEWLDDFMAFHDFAIQNGYTEGLSIDRIDPAGNYEPGNVQFITLSENIGRSSTRANYGKNKTIKISEDDASEICEMYCTGLFTQREIAEGYNVSQMAISNILNEAGITSRPSVVQETVGFKSKLERMRA